MAKFLDDAGLERLIAHWNVKLGFKQDKLTGRPGQVVGFGEDGMPSAQDVITMEDVREAIQTAVLDSWEGSY